MHDSAFANDILIHEFTHGVTGHITASGSARCLQKLVEWAKVGAKVGAT